MKKLRSDWITSRRLPLLLITFLLGWVLILNTNSKVQAGGSGVSNADVSAAPSSLPVGQTTTISIFTYDYQCSNGYAYGTAAGCTQSGGTVTGKKGFPSTVYVGTSGSGNSFSQEQMTTGSDGNGSVTLSSSIAGTKTITVYDVSFQTNGPGSALASTTATFTSVSVSATAPVPHSTKSTPVATTAPPAPVLPSAPTVTQIKVGSKAVPTNQPVTVLAGQPLVLSGMTVANATVTLSIHSKLRTVTVTADKNGNWKYIVNGLPVGSHHIDAQVTDPATKQQSSLSSLLDFTVKPSKNLALITNTKTSFNPWGTIVLPAALAVIVLVGAVFAWRKVRHHRLAGPNTASQTTPTDNQINNDDSPIQDKDK